MHLVWFEFPATHLVWLELTTLAHAIFHQIEPTTLIRLLFKASFLFLALAGRAEMPCQAAARWLRTAARRQPANIEHEALDVRPATAEEWDTRHDCAT